MTTEPVEPVVSEEEVRGLRFVIDDAQATQDYSPHFRPQALRNLVSICTELLDLRFSHDALTAQVKQMREALEGLRSSVSDERLHELKLWLDRKWNRHQEDEDLEAGNALCELIAIRKALAALSQGKGR